MKLKQMQKASFYIESNNTTKQRGPEKAFLVLNSFFNRDTILNTIGAREEIQEESFIIEVITDKTEEELLSIRDQLKQALNQESILITCETIKGSF